MYNIKKLNNISDIIYRYLPEDQYTVSDDVENPDAVIVRSANMHDTELPESLLAIARAGAGVNNIPIDKCTEKGIVVFNTPGANANAVKELVLTGMLISSRKVVEGINWAKSLKGQGSEVPKLVEKGKKNFVGPELYGKKIGVIGLGAIGVLVANAASAIGMEVLGYDPFISVQAAWKLSRAVHRATSLETLLEEADYISLHIPLVNETKDYLNKESFAKMKKGVRIMNFARGELVNTDDLIEAINDGIVDRYVTDFPDDKLLDIDKVIPIPHLGASTPESENNCARMASRQLKYFLETGSIVNSVNFPNCELNGCDKIRLAMPHKNVPSIIGQITSALAQEHVNIANMVNKSKGNVAYTILDLDSKPSASVIEMLEAIDGVFRVRLIDPTVK